jgi:hypothetical protein
MAGLFPDWLNDPYGYGGGLFGGLLGPQDTTPSFSDRWSGMPVPSGGNPVAALSFADRMGGASALPPMQSVETSPLSISEMLGGGRMAYAGAPAAPAANPLAAMAPPAQPASGGGLFGGVAPSAFGPVPQGPSSFNLPSGNPLAGFVGPKAGLGNFGGGGWDPLDIAGPGGALEGPAKWINDNRTMLLLMGAGLAGGGGTGSWNAGLSDALRGMATGGQIDQRQRADAQAQKAALEYVMTSADVPPDLKRAMIANPALAAKFLADMAKPAEFKSVDGVYGSAGPGGKFTPQGAVPKLEKLDPSQTAVYATPPVGGRPGSVMPIQTGGPKFDDISGVRKEVTNLPEVKRYSEALPVFRSMVASHSKNTSAADLDFVYGVAKIFDPDSVVREGEMKLVGKAQSLPEDVKGFISAVALGQGRLTPEARQRILEVARTRMGELEGSLNTRVEPYRGIAVRNRMNPDDILPRFQPLPDAPPPVSIPTPAEIKALKEKYGLK